ncbi:MAG TPA: LamG domain-containing protein [Luteolibacter sp.]|nr:LamG domain-containing protein [Luteolibacter sp.]
MRLIHSTAVLHCAALLALGAEPLHQWNFEPLDPPSGIDESHDPLIRVAGVSGQALVFDGYRTEIVRKPPAATAPEGAFGITAWVAPQEYSWNLSAIINQQEDFQKGYFFGIDHRGRLAGGVALEDGWKSCVSDIPLALLEWSHVAMSFDPANGIQLHVNGKAAGGLRFAGNPVFAKDKPITLGKTQMPMTPANTERATSKAVQSWMYFDGLIDEVGMHDGILSPEMVSRMHGSAVIANPRPLQFRKLPSGTDDPRPFGAYYTRLSFSPGWDARWPGSELPDVVVRFDQSPVKLVFWRGTGYIPAMVTENGIWMTDQSGENFGKGECYEAMGDKQCRYSHVRIIENTPARVVVHWRYALASISHKIMNESDLDPGDWMDEYWTAWPDGVVVRKQVLWSQFERPAAYQFQETIFFNQPGTRPQDNVEDEAITFMNMNGQTTSYSWKVRAPKQFDQGPDFMPVEMVNTRSKYRPFSIHHPERIVRPFSFGWVAGYSTFPCWNHWPVSQIASDGRNAVAPDKASHSSLTMVAGNQQKLERFADGTVRVRSLMGMTTEPIASVLPLARSWNCAPQVVAVSDGFESLGYDPYERAYLFRRKDGNPSALEFTIDANELSPLVQLPVVIRNWGDRPAKVELADPGSSLGGECRVGAIHRLEGSDVVVWIPVKSVSKVRVVIR